MFQTNEVESIIVRLAPFISRLDDETARERWRYFVDAYQRARSLASDSAATLRILVTKEAESSEEEPSVVDNSGDVEMAAASTSCVREHRAAPHAQDVAKEGDGDDEDDLPKGVKTRRKRNPSYMKWDDKLHKLWVKPVSTVCTYISNVNDDGFRSATDVVLILRRALARRTSRTVLLAIRRDVTNASSRVKSALEVRSRSHQETLPLLLLLLLLESAK